MGDNRIHGGRFEHVVQAQHIGHVHFHVPPPRPRALAWRLRQISAVGLACGGGVLLLLGRYRFSAVAPGAAAAVGVLCLAAAVGVELLALWDLHAQRRPEHRPSVAELERATDELAEVLKDRYDRDERLSRIHDPFPIPVRWTAADPLLTDHWPNIRRAGPAPPDGPGAGPPLEVDGRFDEIADLFTSLPVQRLVVLGGPGAGKSVLALHLARRLVGARGPASADPVPVVFPLASWDPRRDGLWNWAAGRIAADHPTVVAGRGAGAHGLALALITSGRVLPVLDGFDELPGPSQADALRELRASLAGPARFLLTSRTEEYAAAVEAGNTVLPSTAVVELQPLTADEVAAYLPRTARRTSRDDASRTAWEPVLRRLNDPADQSREVRVLRAVLGTPLMIGLARVAYSDGGAGADPAELLSAGRFTTRAAVEQHLFDTFLSAAYGGALDDRAGRPAWTADDARRWTGFLARHLRASATQDLEWWRLDEAVPRALRILAALPAFALIMLAVQTAHFGTPSWHKWVGLPFSAAVALVMAGTLSADLADPEPLPGPQRLHRPSGARLRAAVRSRRHWASTAFFLCGMALGTTAVVLLSPGTGRTLAILGTVWFAVHRTARLAGSLRRPADPAEATEPSVLLVADRKATIALAVFDLLGPARYAEHHKSLFGFVLWSVAWWQLVVAHDVLDPADRARAGACFVAASLCHGVAMSAWGRYTVARSWLALTGRLPWRLMAFLRDAHARGILRQAGGVYRFRHIELRNRLARTSEPASAPEPARKWRARFSPWVRAVASSGVVGMLLLPMGVLSMAPPAPYAAVPRACALLDDRLLGQVMSDAVKTADGAHACGAGEQSPFRPDVSVDLRTLVTGMSAYGPTFQSATTMMHGVPFASGPVKGLGDESLEGIQYAPHAHMEGYQYTAVLAARVANVVVVVTYTEEFAKESRAVEVARVLMRAALRRAHLVPKQRQSAQRPLGDLPRTGLPSDTRFAHYSRQAPQTLVGAHWGAAERSHLWRLPGFDYVFRAPKYIDCKAPAQDGTVICTSAGPKGVPLPRLRLSLASQHCVRPCADAARFWHARPGFASTPWKRVSPSVWYAEDTREAGTYRMVLARSASYGKKDVYLVWARAETGASGRALAQKIINDLYTQTGGR